MKIWRIVAVWRYSAVVLVLIAGAAGIAVYKYWGMGGPEQERAWSPVRSQVEALLDGGDGLAPPGKQGATPSPRTEKRAAVGRMPTAEERKDIGSKPSGSPSASQSVRVSAERPTSDATVPPTAAPSDPTPGAAAIAPTAPPGHVPPPSGEHATGPRSGTDTLIDINTASAARLTELPGIGESKARAIVKYREENGPFRSPSDIMKVKGIGPKTYESLKKRITASP